MESALRPYFERMPRSPPPPTIRGALFALLALAFVPLVLFGGWQVARDYQVHSDAETRASGELARSVAAAAEAFVLNLVRAERGLAASFAAQGAGPKQIERTLAAFVASLPPVRDMSWLDGEGRVVASTEPYLAGRSFYARNYFQEIAHGADWRVSTLMQSVVDGRATFIVARGIRDEAGELVAVITAAVDAERFGAAVLSDRGTAGASAIRDAEGTLVAVSPLRSMRWEDRRRGSETPWLGTVLSGREKLGAFQSPLTDERRIGAIVPIRALRWAAQASRPFDAAIAPVRRIAVFQVAVLLAVILVAFAAALYVARGISTPLRALEAEAERLASGGEPRGALHGPVEVRRVGSALRTMAEGLAERRTKLDRLQDERETLMRSVTHDLRTPLHVIVCHATLLQRRIEIPDLRRRADVILASADRMARLMGDLIDAARIDAGHLTLELEAMDLGAFLLGWKDRVAGALPINRVRVEVLASSPPIRADPVRVDQILTNLASNALKYSLPGSEVRIALAATPSALRLTVSDQGPGIPSDDLPRLFERYYRAKGTARAEGLGLGLFITRKLVEAHGWRTEVESTVGKGSVFTVVVPVADASAAQALLPGLDRSQQQQARG